MKKMKNRQTSLGKSFREGLSLIQLTRMFPDDRKAEQWFVRMRWPNGVSCSRCGSLNIQKRPTLKPQPYRCRDCRNDFSVKTGTLMHRSHLGCQTWAIAIYLATTHLKGVSSMKLHRDLGITQKTAWFLSHRIRDAWENKTGWFAGPVEVDEAYFGGKERNKHATRKLRSGRGTVGKVAVVGVKDRATNQVSATPVEQPDRKSLGTFVRDRVSPKAQLYTDGNPSYEGFQKHEAVRHHVGEYVRGMAHTNGIESFWSMLKRGYMGTFHRISSKHLGRYVREFAGRHNDRCLDTIEQMASIVRGMDGKRLSYKELIG